MSQPPSWLRFARRHRLAIALAFAALDRPRLDHGRVAQHGRDARRGGRGRARAARDPDAGRALDGRAGDRDGAARLSDHGQPRAARAERCAAREDRREPPEAGDPHRRSGRRTPSRRRPREARVRRRDRRDPRRARLRRRARDRRHRPGYCPPGRSTHADRGDEGSGAAPPSRPRGHAAPALPQPVFSPSVLRRFSIPSFSSRSSPS